MYFIFGNVHMNEQLGEWGFWIDDCDIFDLIFTENHTHISEQDRSERTTENSKNTTQGDTRENTRNENTIKDSVSTYWTVSGCMRGAPVNPDDVNMYKKQEI